MSQGMVYLVGAGPGDPGLITRLGEQAIRRAQVLVYDHLVHPRLVALAPVGAKRIYVGKSRGHHEMPQDEINRTLCREAQAGQVVVRLKGGDPFVFGRGAEEAESLHAEGIPFRVVPGVTAGIGALAYAGLPVTHRDYASSVVFVTGHDHPDDPGCRADWPHLARFAGTIVIYMGVTRLPRIAQVLIEYGKSPETPVALVERGSWPGQRVVVRTLQQVAASEGNLGVSPPALVMIGDVVSARPALDWWGRLPLAGKRVLITRPEEDAARSVEQLEELGAEVLVAPTITVRPADDPTDLDQALSRLGSFDWGVFTSSHGVRFFIERIFQTGRDLRLLGHARLAAIGPMTAQTLRGYGLVADLVPSQYRSEELAAELAELVKGKRVLLARADRGRTLLKDELQGIAAEVVQASVYHNADAENLPPEVLKKLLLGEVDWVTLTSSAIVRRFAAMLPTDLPAQALNNIKFASISPITSQAACEVGLEPAVEAREFTFQGVIEAIAAFERSHKS